ncbi:hypothetical protein SAMN06272735_5009 [Streptomyces sp. TLI_55]|nr:hypothetical protein SAMN06272735_5009 [Streptomyces sp. TLI_55]
MVMWYREASGAAKRIPISEMGNQTAEQAAVAPDGSIYLATGDLWKVSPGGSATKIVDTDCKKDTSTADSTKLSDFCTGQVTGVTVTKDGSVYFGDEITLGHRGSFVHKISGDAVELIAGRSSKDGESLKRSNPAVQNGIAPAAGTKAKAVLVPDIWNSGWLAADEHGLYWRTGPGVVHINADGTLSPLVGAKAPDKVTEAGAPFEKMGRALDAEIGESALDQLRGDLAVTSERGEVFYTDAQKTYSPPFSSEYRWGGDKSASQKDFIENLVGGKAIYRVAAGEVSPTAVGVQGIAASGTSLYIAAESTSGTKESAEDQLTAVLQVELPEEK